ncbi:9553_t:CDS:2, partial [Dentiscutata erythropus]
IRSWDIPQYLTSFCRDNNVQHDVTNESIKLVDTSISSWKEIKDFPPIISPLAYQLLMIIILLISIALSFNLPTTKIHFFILYALAFLQILIPMLYNSKYHCSLQAASSVVNFVIACKLLIWLKKCHSSNTQKSEFNSFFSTLFIWRPDALKINKPGKRYIDQITIKDYLVNQGQHSVSKISKSQSQSILSSKIQEFKEWLILLLFYTKVPLNFPFISTSPRDFWSRRWHVVLREIFVDLGYDPVKSLFGKHKKFVKIFGTLSAFFVSGLLHEHIVYCMWGTRPGEQMIFFLSHGLLLILWEVVEGFLVGNGIVINEVKDSWGIWLFKLVLFNTIAIFTIPLFMEPYLRKDSFVCMIQVGLFHNQIGLS